MNETKELLRRGVGDFEPTPDAFDRVVARRDRKRRTQRVAAGVLGIAMFALAAIGFARLLGSESIPAEEPAQEPSVDLGIFEPIAGRMIYSGLSRLWAVDLNAPSPVSTIVPLEVEGAPLEVEGTPLAWSSDGTELLLMREDPTDQTFPYDE